MKRKTIRTIVMIIDIISYSKLIIFMLWTFALISLATAIYQQLTK